MANPPKSRLDQLCVERGLFLSRNQAQAAILAGEIFSEDQLLAKPGHMFPVDLPITFKSRSMRYVSRGGFKLEGALKDFKLDVYGFSCVDLGSSTGGFTDCLLQQGAERVCCIDVGKGQLHYQLRQDKRISLMESVNARYLTPADVPGTPFDLAVIDVSFISLTKIMPVAAQLVKQRTGRILALIKPQFELGPMEIGKGGIVKDKKAHEKAILHVVEHLGEWGLAKVGVKPSVLKGTDGNQEYLLLAEKLT